MIEIWRDIKGYEELYRVSNEGQVKSLKRKNEIILAQSDNNGYKIVGLVKNGQRKGFLVHRLVATAFISNPYNHPHCGHENDRRGDNRAANLYWTTAVENANHNGINVRRKYATIKRLEKKAVDKATKKATAKDRADTIEYIRRAIVFEEARERLSRAY